MINLASVRFIAICQSVEYRKNVGVFHIYLGILNFIS